MPDTSRHTCPSLMAAPGPPHLPSCPCLCPHLSSVRASLYMTYTWLATPFCKHLFITVHHTFHICICPHLLSVPIHTCRVYTYPNPSCTYLPTLVTYVSAHTCHVHINPHLSFTCLSTTWAVLWVPVHHLSVPACLAVPVPVHTCPDRLSLHLISCILFHTPVSCTPAACLYMFSPRQPSSPPPSCIHECSTQCHAWKYICICSFLAEFSYFTFGTQVFTFTEQEDHVCTRLKL